MRQQTIKNVAAMGSSDRKFAEDNGGMAAGDENAAEMHLSGLQQQEDQFAHLEQQK